MLCGILIRYFIFKICFRFLCLRSSQHNLGHVESVSTNVLFLTSDNELLGIIYNLFRGRQNIFLTIFSTKFVVVLRLNVPVNNFSVMSGRSHRFLGN